MTPEAKVKASVVKLLKKHDIYYFFPATHGFGRSGVPDIVCCYNSLFMGIECKAGKGKVTALQERELSLIREAGGVTFIINEDSVKDLERWITDENFDMDGRC